MSALPAGPPHPRAALRTLWRVLVEGGITVATPPAAPVLATLIQADGGIVVSVAWELLRGEAEPGRAALLAAHAAGVQAALQPVARLLALLGRLDQWVRAIRRYGALASLALLALPATSAARRDAAWTIAAWALPSLVLPALTLALRPLLLGALRWRLGPIVAEAR